MIAVAMAAPASGGTTTTWTNTRMTFISSWRELSSRILCPLVYLWRLVRFLGRHGSSRVSREVLVGAVPPHLVAGVPLSTFDSFREAFLEDRSKFLFDVPSGRFLGFNRLNANVSQGKIWSWWQQGIQSGFKNAHDGIKEFSATDATQNLQGIDILILVLHGDDDQGVPVVVSAMKTTKLLKHETLKEISGGPLRFRLSMWTR